MLNGDLENNSYVFIEHVLTETAHNEALEGLYDQNLARWTHFSTVVVVFARRAITPFRLACSVSKFIRKNLEEKSAEIGQAKKPLDFSLRFP